MNIDLICQNGQLFFGASVVINFNHEIYTHLDCIIYTTGLLSDPIDESVCPTLAVLLRRKLDLATPPPPLVLLNQGLIVPLASGELY